MLQHPSRGLHAGRLRLIVMEQKCKEKEKKDDRVKKTVQELKTG